MRRTHDHDERILTVIKAHASRMEPCGYSQIHAETEIPKMAIKESLERLRDAGKVRSPTRGLYVPVEQHPEPRIISRTVLPNGCEKLEFAGRDGGEGETLLMLTPTESKMLAKLYSGTAYA